MKAVETKIHEGFDMYMEIITLQENVKQLLCIGAHVDLYDGKDDDEEEEEEEEEEVEEKKEEEEGESRRRRRRRSKVM